MHKKKGVPDCFLYLPLLKGVSGRNMKNSYDHTPFFVTQGAIKNTL